VIISLAFADNGLSRPEVRLITTNYGGGRVDDSSPNELSRDEIARD